MPVTAKFSRATYDQLGETVVNELVDLLNRMDAEFKTELRELNDRSGARTDAKIEQLGTELRGELRLVATGLESQIRATAADLRNEIHITAAELDKRIATSGADLKTYVERGLREQTRFFFLAWAVLLASNIGLWFRS